jgi:hypothetical protein
MQQDFKKILHFFQKYLHTNIVKSVGQNGFILPLDSQDEYQVSMVRLALLAGITFLGRVGRGGWLRFKLYPVNL